MIGPDTKLIALIGNPIRHSFSPRIQNYFIEKYSKDAVYLVFELREENLKEAFNGAKKLGFAGLNVTMPYKKEVFKLVDKADRISTAIKSVNTVKFDKKTGTSKGFNTDVPGFLCSLDKKKFNWSGSNCLVIGAGGAARGAIYGMLKKKVKEIWVYNRTKEKVNEIIRDLKNEGSNKIKALNSINDIDNKINDINLIVNCTPLGMDIKSFKNVIPVPGRWNLRGKFIFDMVYKPIKTLLLKKAKKEGAKVIDGIDLLVYQAASSFEVWFGIMPEHKCIEEIKRTILIDIENNKLKY